MIAERRFYIHKKCGKTVRSIKHVVIHPNVEKVTNTKNDYVCKCCGEQFTQQINGFVVNDRFERASDAYLFYKDRQYEVHECKVS